MGSGVEHRDQEPAAAEFVKIRPAAPNSGVSIRSRRPGHAEAYPCAKDAQTAVLG